MNSFLITGICCLALIIFIKWQQVKRYWANLGIPYMPPNFFLGNLTFMLQQNPGIWMRNIYQNYKSPYVGIWLFWRPALIINCPDIARNVLNKDSVNFRDRFMSSGPSDPVGHYNLFLVKEPLWSKLRKHFTSVFTTSKLKNVHSIALAKSDDLITRITNEMKKGSMELRKTFIDYTTDVFGTASFGVASDATLTGGGPLRKITQELMEYNTYRGLCWSCIFFWPELVPLFGFTFVPKETTKYFRQVFREILLARKQIVQDNEVQCLIDALVQLKDKDLIDKAETENIIVAQAVVFLIGGFETSASALTYTLYHLAFDEDKQSRLYNELLEAYQKYGKSFVNYEHITELTYMDCILKESLRLHPPMGWINRVALNDYRVDDKLTIKTGTSVYVNANGMHYDPEYFPNPYTFNPDRFLPENEKNMTPYSYLPFGEGPRKCIAKRFGELTIKSALAKVIFNFKVLPLPKAPKPLDVEIDKYSFVYSPGETLKLNFTPRTNF